MIPQTACVVREGIKSLPSVYIFARGVTMPVSQKSYANFPLVRLGQDAGSTAIIWIILFAAAAFRP